MRLQVETKEGDKIEGVLELKDESFIMLKISKNIVRVFPWNTINTVKRRGENNNINLESFRKARE